MDKSPVTESISNRLAPLPLVLSMVYVAIPFALVISARLVVEVYNNPLDGFVSVLS